MRVYFRCELVKCGKPNCRRCPNHGPYWYRYAKDKKGRLKKTYLGRQSKMEAALQALVHDAGPDCFIRVAVGPSL